MSIRMGQGCRTIVNENHNVKITCADVNLAGAKTRHKKAPEAKASGAILRILNYATWYSLQFDALPATANLADIAVDIFPHDAAVTAIAVAVVIGVAAITGAVITAVIAAAVIAWTNADSDADRTRADPHTLRACRHRQCDSRRRQNSDCKLSHWSPPRLLDRQRTGAWGVPV